MTPSYHPDRIARNTSYLTIALTAQKVLSFVYFIYISRSIGSEEIGRYLFALSLTTIVGVFIDIGLNPVLTREIAKDPQKTHLYLNTTFSLKLLLAVLAYGAVFLFINLPFLGYPAETKHLVYLSGLVMIFDTFVLSFYSIFRGYQVLKYESLGVILNKVVVMGLGVLFVLMHKGTLFLVLAILFGSLFNFVYTVSLLIRKVQWRPRFYLDKNVLKALLRIALPFAIASIFTVIYGSIDSVLLNMLSGARGNSFVGWYGTAYKLTYSFQFIPIAVGAAVFPAMSSYFISSKALLARTFERASYYLLVIVMPIVFGVFAVAEKLILRLWGNAFGTSIHPLQILIFSLIFVFLTFPIGALLNASNRQTRNTINIGIAMVVNIILNLILIPKYTFIGTSISSLVSTFILFALGLSVVRQTIAVNWRYLVTIVFKTLVSALIMVGILLALKERVSFIILIPLGVVIYFLALFLFRGFGQNEYKRIFHVVLRRFS